MSARRDRNSSVRQSSEPIFNIPPVIVATIAAFIFVHALRSLALDPEQDIEFLLRFAFIPGRYDSSLLAHGAFPGGIGAEIWSFVTYAFIHGDVMHLTVNAIWLLPFGTAVARRFGPVRFFALFAASAAAGALAHLVTHGRELVPMIGSSAAISGFMAAAIRFAFQKGGPLGMFRRTDPEAYLVPAAPLSVVLRDFRVLAFLVVWFGLNAIFGMGTVAMPGVEQTIAWQAHIGGFLAGLLLFAFFDPVPRQRTID
jgi:membrane associated rhomboid family serine protease